MKALILAVAVIGFAGAAHAFTGCSGMSQEKTAEAPPPPPASSPSS